jgi:hypothetical protein
MVPGRSAPWRPGRSGSSTDRRDCAGRPVLDGDDIDAGAFVDLYLDLRRQPDTPVRCSTIVASA